MDTENCFHCGNEILKKDEIVFDEKKFCCNGCKTVYEIFSQNDLTCYYDFQAAPGATPQDIQGKYDFLDNEEICKHTSYKGKRVKRGLFKSNDGTLINADVNGSLNILKKVVGNFNYDSIEVCSTPSVYTVKFN